MTEDLHPIGQVARLSGLPVPTVRFYSDAGLVPVAGRSPGGYRLYDREALGRLELIRTLRDLGVDLPTITRVLTGAHTLAEVAGREAAALEARIQTLRVRRAVLRYAATSEVDAPGLARVNRLARLSEEQRRALVGELIEEAAGGLGLEPGFAARLRSALPDLPDDPAPEQLEAWVELAHLVVDPDFRAGMRRAFERHAADRASGADEGDPRSWQEAEEAVLELAGGALARGVPPGSVRGRAVADELVAVFARAHRRRDDAEFRTWLAERIHVGADVRVSRYRRLLAVINGGPAAPDPVPAARWFLAALTAGRDDDTMRIRAVREEELGVLRDIERAAGECFRDIGMAEIADDEPFSLETLAAYRRAGRGWVTADNSGRPVAYLLADPIDGNLHVEQVSVHPACARRGLGRALLDHLAGLAAAGGLPALTLTTFRDVPWNAPYYERCGFRRLDDAALTPGLRELRRRETAHGLDRWPRVCMRRDV